MALWCRDLPTVTVPQSATPKPLTIVLPYYAQPLFLDTQASTWRGYPADLAARLTVNLVDDGSPTACVLPSLLPCAVRLFRIGVDIRWNWLAARNIGAHHAAEGWLLLTDMDHILPESTCRAVMYGQHDPAVVYAFSRREHTGETIAPHSASFLMTRKMFWKIGGYDEALSGHYGTDGEYRRRVAKTAKIQILTDALIRHEFVGDSSTTRYQRKQPEDARVGQLVKARRPGWRPRVLSFPYAEVGA